MKELSRIQRLSGGLLVSLVSFVPMSSFGQVVVNRLGTLGGSSVNAYDLNNAGQAVGTAFTAGNQEQHAVVFLQGTATDLLTLGGRSATAFALSDNGLVVGQSSTAGDLATHAFLWAGGVITDLGGLGGTISFATGVNAQGQVSGNSYLAGDLFQHAFRVDNGTMIDLGTLGGGASSAAAINDQGIVVGDSSLAGEMETHAFLHDGAALVDLGTLGGGFSAAVALNNAGWVVGQASLPFDVEQHAFLFDGVEMRDLGTLGGAWSDAYAINDSGWVAGDSTTLFDAEYHGFIYGNGALVDLTTLGGDYSSVWDLNNRGQVVGETTDGEGQLRAFLWENGVMTDLNTLLPPGAEWELFSAMFINDAGDIVGIGLNQGKFDWFVLNLGQGPANRPPAAEAGLDQVVECGGDLTAVTLNGGGSQDPDGDALVYTWSEGGSAVGSGVALTVALASGVHVLMLTVTDPDGELGQDTVTITVQDTTAPVVSCPVVGPLNANRHCVVPMPNLLSNVVAFDQCSSAQSLAVQQSPPPGTLLDHGVHTVTFTATDSAGNQGSCAVAIEVVDRRAPVIRKIVSQPEKLCPPNKRMIPVALRVSARDNCDPNPVTRIVAVRKNGGDPGADAVITGPLTVELRAVASNKNKPTVYTLIVECVDVSGNHSRARIRVPVGSPEASKKVKKAKR